MLFLHFHFVHYVLSIVYQIYFSSSHTNPRRQKMLRLDLVRSLSNTLQVVYHILFYSSVHSVVNLADPLLVLPAFNGLLDFGLVSVWYGESGLLNLVLPTPSSLSLPGNPVAFVP